MPGHHELRAAGPGKPGRTGRSTRTRPRAIFLSAIANGLFYFDCADVYGRGTCETVVGRLLRELLHRDEYVLQTKVAMPMGQGPHQGGLSRKHIMEGIDASPRGGWGTTTSTCW